MLKSPVADQCKDAGLKGCDQLTEGVLGFVDGSDKEAAKQKIAKGASQNEPAELASFASRLKTVAKLPGLDGFGPQLNEVASLLEGSPVKISSAEASRTTPSGPSEDLRTKTVTAIVAGHPRAYACNPMGKTTQVYAGATCLRIGIGPLVVTDLVGGSCSSELLVLSGNVDAPTWVVSASSHSSHGARFVVAPDDELTVVLKSSAPLARDASCGVTISSHK